MKISGFIVGALALTIALPGWEPAQAHVVIYKTCLTDTVLATSPARHVFQRRPHARRSAVYSWGALSSDEFGKPYGDFALSNNARAVCERSDSGSGFQCSLSGIPCREVKNCDEVEKGACLEEER